MHRRKSGWKKVSKIECCVSSCGFVCGSLRVVFWVYLYGYGLNAWKRKIAMHFVVEEREEIVERKTGLVRHRE